MPAFNHNSSLLGVSGVNHRFTNVRFTTGAVAGVLTSFSGAFVQSVTRTGVGTYLITLSPFAPVALVSAAGRDPGNARGIRIGAVTLDSVTKTVTLVALTNNVVGGALLDAANLDARIILHWKMFSGTDRSGL